MAELLYEKLLDEIGIKGLLQHTFIVHPTAMMYRERIIKYGLHNNTDYMELTFIKIVICKWLFHMRFKPHMK